MLNKLIAIDSWIIERVFEPFAQWLEAHTGKNNFWWAKVIIISFPLLGIASYQVTGTLWSPSGLGSSVGFLLGATAFYWEAVYAEHTNKPGLRGITRTMLYVFVRYWWWTILAGVTWIFILVPATTFGMLVGGTVCILVMQYMIACSSPSQLKQMKKVKLSSQQA